MERREGMPVSGVAMALEEAGASSQFPQRASAPAPEEPSIESPSHGGGVISLTATAAGMGPAAQPQPQPQQPVLAGPSSSEVAIASGSLSAAMPVKKKVGRPRKYAPDGSGKVIKRGRVRKSGFLTKDKQRIDLEALGDMVAYSAGVGFTPHVITVASGEDVTMKIISFSQQGPLAVCILSANGVVSNVTLRQPDSSGGTLTYEGWFEILSLSGSFMPNDNGGTISRSGGISVSLASPDGRVLGGAVAGLLIAASPVKVVLGSFFQQKTKKPKQDSSVATETVAIPMSTMDIDETHSGGQGQLSSSAPNPIVGTSSFRGEENLSSTLDASVHDARNSTTDINTSLPGG
ncbi:AT-hook motif nuclear-localized protein 1 [Dendrobium catenatum]|uniref:AT-hook motif nuclear-localized protein n=1 Tax=Dendrobium catenatum TaxID=906689 RepID=A0A2I0VJL2_9ASPA|nr:AT-hook motif nuclear-localized protein 1 [Dendrobium catenatum]PKU63597.1 Putative DNA-binding protein ESCAROLA [Dendrobium catenatum]